MAKVREEKPKSFTEFVGLVEQYRSSSSHELWYRGCGRADYELVPSLYRHKTETTIKKVAVLEQQLMVRFRQRSIPLLTRPLGDDWDTLFFMQHYRIPTRLLDWTENPFIALHFAVMSASVKSMTRGLKFEEPAAVWLMNPVIWNQQALSHQSYNGGVLVPGDEPLKGYQPRETFTGMNNFPVALYGAHNSPRIVAQRGVFVIFGQNISPMESLYSSEKSFQEGSLVKIIISKALLPNMRKAILEHGVTESVVYPDLEGLSMEMRRIFGFEHSSHVTKGF